MGVVSQSVFVDNSEICSSSVNFARRASTSTSTRGADPSAKASARVFAAMMVDCENYSKMAWWDGPGNEKRKRWKMKGLKR